MQTLVVLMNCSNQTKTKHHKQTTYTSDINKRNALIVEASIIPLDNDVRAH
jgi:hypothetical protein